MKTRIIHTRFWQDSFVLNLSQNARLLFIYILTNERLGLVGAYECPDQFIMLETGLNSGQLEKAKTELEGKVLFDEGWVALKNATKYNNYSANEVHKNAYEKELSSLPENVRNFVLDKEYLCTSPRLDKNNKYKIKDKKQETKIQEYLTKDQLDELQAKFPTKLVRNEYEKAKDWLKSSGKTKKDYVAFMRNWLRNSKDERPVPKQDYKIPEELVDHDKIKKLQELKGNFAEVV